MTTKTQIWLSTAALAAAAALVSPAGAADFFKGKTIKIIVGYSPGGGYDIYSRNLGRYMDKHIPGKPNIIVQNMTGAGSLRAANYIYQRAPKDGTQFGLQVLDLQGQGRLRNRTGLGCPAKMAVTGKRFEVLQLFQCDVSHKKNLSL